MTMMSKESIELEHIEKQDGGIGEVGLDKEQIEREYENQIAGFLDEYHKSDLRCDHESRHP